MHHLFGLKSWNEPNIPSANFSVKNFSVFLPKRNVSPGKIWELIPIDLAGHSFQG